MKNIVFIMLSFCVFLFAPGLCMAAEEEPHPEITLIDYDGNEISLDSNVPYSPKNTCGECHDYDAITNAYHFQQGRTDAGISSLVMIWIQGIPGLSHGVCTASGDRPLPIPASWPER